MDSDLAISIINFSVNKLKYSSRTQIVLLNKKQDPPIFHLEEKYTNTFKLKGQKIYIYTMKHMSKES